MKKPPLQFMKNEYIEDVTAQRIREYEAKTGSIIKLPVPVEQIVEQVLDLTILWDAVEEQPGELILGGLQAKSRTIVRMSLRVKRSAIWLMCSRSALPRACNCCVYFSSMMLL